MSTPSLPITYRAAEVSDLPFLWEMLFEAAFTTDEQRGAWRAEPVHPPELAKYLDGWGRAGDVGVVAIDADGTPVGAAWYRIFTAAERGDGILAPPGVPELSIAVEPRCRGRGVGAALLAELARRARDGGYARLLLSVDPANAAARRLYERAGFAYVETDDAARGTSLIMGAGGVGVGGGCEPRPAH